MEEVMFLRSQILNQNIVKNIRWIEQMMIVNLFKVSPKRGRWCLLALNPKGYDR